MMSNLILGLDPGSRRTGFGVISTAGGTLRHIDHGVIELKESWPLPQRLHVLSEELHKVFARVGAAEAVVEKIFFGKNADSAFKLGHARGVCLMLAARHQAAVHEYAAKFVKKSVTGSGAASKDQVQLVIGRLLGIQAEALIHDASDALALAVTHARESESQALIRRAMERNL